MMGTGGACGFRGYAGSAMLLLAPAFEGYVGCVWGGARAVEDDSVFGYDRGRTS
jgi:hypothetical protein